MSSSWNVSSLLLSLQIPISLKTPGLPYLLPPVINYPVQIQFVPALCSEVCTLCCTTLLSVISVLRCRYPEGMNYKICVTETEHISDKFLSSEWRLLDDLQVCNGPLKNVCFAWWRKVDETFQTKGSWLHLRKTTVAHVASNVSPDRTHLWKFKFDP